VLGHGVQNWVEITDALNHICASIYYFELLLF